MTLNTIAPILAQAGPIVRGDTNVELVWGIVLFILAGAGMILGALTLGRFIRPHLPHPEKKATYECGEPSIGDSWVQFDLRFYIVALFFIIFDVEIALLWPWAVVFKDFGNYGLCAMLFFLVPILVGFAYDWRFGYLDWVRASTGQRGDESARAVESQESLPAAS